ncbi:hypothetical protein M427DRAFT_341049 [Gonapodya prolifera JEL478]|uniref:Uncharacterized protein n=1 Tax=Gonapodya prolifera (strain JEL478) TaxID=1344416 RepID=A0A139AC51_GONPJ|nr:hypothetical protein M427DRAFT_341049 [Gonapodya prolifera JEL478]|eukprot:KXS14381.1 hypothetical protein M427DRAFT_341049 [Gonapodya prolifera JEL478]
MQSFIPRTLNEVRHVEQDAEKVVRGEGGDLIYSKIARVRHELGPQGPTAVVVAAGEKQDVHPSGEDVRPAAEANGKASRSRVGKGDREDEESDASKSGSESDSESRSGLGEDGEDGAPRSRLRSTKIKRARRSESRPSRKQSARSGSRRYPRRRRRRKRRRGRRGGRGGNKWEVGRGVCHVGRASWLGGMDFVDESER